MSKLFEPGYYTEKELKNQNFKHLGERVQIGKNCTIIGCENISIGNDVRIDGYCTFIASGAGSLTIGSNIHIGAYTLLYAGAGISIGDFSGISQGVKIYTIVDDFSGLSMTGPMVPSKFTKSVKGAVTLNRHVLIGSSSVVLPGCTIGEGSAVGALSLVTTSLKPWGVYFGSPVKRLKDRSKKVLDLEAEFLSNK